MYDVFLSYEAHSSSKLIQAFEHLLKDSSFVCIKSRDGGKLEPQIFNSNLVIFFLTKKYFQCASNRFELDYAQMMDKGCVFVYMESDLTQSGSNNNAKASSVEINGWKLSSAELFNQLIELIKEKKRRTEYSQNTLDVKMHLDDYVIKNEGAFEVFDEDTLDLL